MSQARRQPDWFERHDAEIRELAWLGTIAGAPHPSTITEAAEPTDPDEASPPLASESGAEPPAMTEDREALLRSEEALATAHAAMASLQEELHAARADAEAARAELQAMQQTMHQFAATMSEDAEAELVKLALTVAERVVARELAMAPDLVVAWAREAIASSELGGRFIVATSADLSESLADSAWGDLEPSLRMDPALAPGTCEIRDGGRLITVSSEARLEVIKDSLSIDKPKAA